MCDRLRSQARGAVRASLRSCGLFFLTVLLVWSGIHALAQSSAPRQAVPRESSQVGPRPTPPDLCPNSFGTRCNSSVAPLPEGWHHGGIGRSRLAGDAAYVDGVFAVASAGIGAGGISDQFHYVYRAASGDVDVIARLADTDDRHPLMTAGVMVRGSLNANAAHAFMLATERQGTAFHRRLVAGWTTSTTPGSTAVSNWLKLERRGLVVSAFASANGTTWQLIGTELIELGPSFYVGLAVASRQPGSRAMAVFDEVRVRSLATTSDTPGATPDDPQPGPVVPPAPVLYRRYRPRRHRVQSHRRPSPIRRHRTRARHLCLQFRAPRHQRRGCSCSSLRIDHDANVDSYVFEVVVAGPAGGTVRQQNMGKPPVVRGECSVDITAILQSLPAGSYVGMLRAVNAYGSSPAASSAVFSIQ